jgi:hypothetical protein
MTGRRSFALTGNEHRAFVRLHCRASGATATAISTSGDSSNRNVLTVAVQNVVARLFTQFAGSRIALIPATSSTTAI